MSLPPSPLGPPDDWFSGVLRFVATWAQVQEQRDRERRAAEALRLAPLHELSRRLSQIGVLSAKALTDEATLSDRDSRLALRRALQAVIAIVETGDPASAGLQWPERR